VGIIKIEIIINSLNKKIKTNKKQDAIDGNSDNIVTFFNVCQ
jgi:hypothetical protein